jgi:hypothetical protein
MIEGLATEVVDMLSSAAEAAEVAKLSRDLGLMPVVIVPGLLAQAEADRDPNAARVARALFRDAHPAEVVRALQTLRL